MTISIADIVGTVDGIVSFPEIHLRINQMLNDPDCDLGKIGDTISYDPGLTAQLLRMANSPFYGLSKEVDTVNRALQVVGLSRLRYMLLATSAVKTFNGVSNELVSMDNFWLHSLYCALAAKLLAEEVKGLQADTLFVAGLLHDIGQLILFNQLPELSRESLLKSVELPDEPDTHTTEQDTIGFDHAELGAELARHWQWPSLLIETIRYHHEPDRAESHPREAAVVHLANSIAVLAELHTANFDETDAPHIAPFVWELLEIREEMVPALLDNIHSQFAETRALLGFN